MLSRKNPPVRPLRVAARLGSKATDTTLAVLAILAGLARSGASDLRAVYRFDKLQRLLRDTGPGGEVNAG